MKKILETQRLYLREMTQEDFADLCEILQDKQTMYAYEHAFSDKEAQKWLDKQINRYKNDGFGLWAVIDKESGVFLGQCGITWQDIGGETVPEIGYLFKRKHWHNGYAAEAAQGCKKYAFNMLGFGKVYSIIRDNNYASQNVSKRNGTTVVKTIIKHYYNMDMPHLVYCVERPIRFEKSNSLKIYLSEQDKELISSPECISNAISENNVLAFDIYSGDLLIGFAMIRQFSSNGFFMWDFAIDSNLQNKHYGEQALKELMSMLKERYNAKIITTTYKYGNTHAEYVYKKLGFVETDIIIENGINEVNMEIKL